jgi:hypothetical protein
MVYWLAYLLRDSNGKGSSMADNQFFLYYSDIQADRFQSIALIMVMPSIISPFMNAIATTHFFLFIC